MRCEDTLFFKNNDLALKLGENLKYKPEQIAYQIKKQKEVSSIEYGIKIREKNSKIMKYTFYLKDYLKRRKNELKSAISIYFSNDFYNEYNVIYVLLNSCIDASLEIQNVNENIFISSLIIDKNKNLLYALNLKKAFKRMREIKMEKQLESSLLEETIKFNKKDFI